MLQSSDFSQELFGVESGNEESNSTSNEAPNIECDELRLDDHSSTNRESSIDLHRKAQRLIRENALLQTSVELEGSCVEKKDLASFMHKLNNTRSSHLPSIPNKTSKESNSSEKLKMLLIKMGISSELLARQPKISAPASAWIKKTNSSIGEVDRSFPFFVKKKSSIDQLNDMLEIKQKLQYQALMQRKREREERILTEALELEEPMVIRGCIIDEPEQISRIEDNALISGEDSIGNDAHLSSIESIDEAEQEEILPTQLTVDSSLDSSSYISNSKNSEDENSNIQTESDEENLFEESRLLNLISQKFNQQQLDEENSFPSFISPRKRPPNQFIEDEAEVEDEFGNIIDNQNDSNDEFSLLDEAQMHQEMIQSKFIQQSEELIDPQQISSLYRQKEIEREKEAIDKIYAKLSHNKRSLDLANMIEKYKGEEFEKEEEYLGQIEDTQISIDVEDFLYTELIDDQRENENNERAKYTHDKNVTESKLDVLFKRNISLFEDGKHSIKKSFSLPRSDGLLMKLALNQNNYGSISAGTGNSNHVKMNKKGFHLSANELQTRSKAQFTNYKK